MREWDPESRIWFFFFPSLPPLCLIMKTLGLRGLMQFDGQVVSILHNGEQALPTH